MSFIPHTIVTVVFALFIPSTTATDVHTADPDPLPEPAAQVVTQPIPEPEPEVKPLPSEPPRVSEQACNCYNILKENFDSVPSMNQILATATTSHQNANVAVFRYAATPDWPNGIPHVAIVHGELPDGSLQIEEYNYHSCTHSFRTISPTDPRLVGFHTL